MTLFGTFSHARVLEWDGRGLILGFPADSLHAQLAADATTLAQLKKHTSEILGRPVEIKVQAVAGMQSGVVSTAGAGPGPRSFVEKEAAERLDARQKREQEARKHPITEAVIETFGASIKEIKVDG